MWDPDRDGYMYGDKLAENICSLGLAMNKEFIFRLMSILLKRPLDNLAKEKITKEEFSKLAHSSRLVNRILKILNEATKTMILEQKKGSVSRIKIQRPVDNIPSGTIESALKDENIAGLFYNAKIFDHERSYEVKRVQTRVKYHYKLIILHEILNDVIEFKNLRDPDSATDYQEKLVFIN